MVKKYKNNCLMLLCIGLTIFATPQYAQVSGSIQQEVKWMKVSRLHSWFSSGGAEIEYGRRSRSFLNTDQLDGTLWPGDYTFQDVSVGKSLWIGTKDFADPISGITYPYKVACMGRINMYLGSEVYPESITLVGNREHPAVLVDDIGASFLEYDDNIDVLDEDMTADRMIVNEWHTAIGVSCKRTVRAFSQQYHNNYYIYEYVFTNTGIIDESGIQKLEKPLSEVIFHWQYRYGFAGESYREGWAPTGAAWGLNTVNNAVGFDDAHQTEDGLRAAWAYYGSVSTSPGYADDIGLPNHTNGDILAGSNYAGVVVLHADKSASDKSDDPNQPITTHFQPSDRGAQGVDQFDANLMTRKYVEFMSAGHAEKTHAEQVGTSFANTWGGDAGGYAISQGFGPYDLEIGDSVRIVVAEAVAGIMSNREHVREIAHNWFNDTGDFVLPDGSATTDRNEYKNTWVQTGEDSLFTSLRRAKLNYENGYNIDTPPPPPENFIVRSAGNGIVMEWANNAESWPNFNGYNIFRAEGRVDTTFDLIWSCDRGNVVNSFIDTTAKRGFSYYFYIQSKDDGSTNSIEPGVPLVSSKFYTLAVNEAFLTRAPGTNLSEIRIVPNPYNISARDLQFGQDAPDRIAFYGLPPYCTIKIFTETGTLIETIDHNNGSGDELWHSLTSSRQLVVSGIYIVYFEVTEDAVDSSGNIIHRKGDNTIQKLIIIR